MHPYTLLIVDDSKTQLALYNAMFSASYTLKQCESGQEALEIIAREPPDIIMLDIEMPQMDGYQVCEKLRADGHRMPVIFVSAKIDMAQRLRAYDAGGNDFVSKPAPDDELQRKIALLLRQHEETERLRADGAMAMATAMTVMTTLSEMGVVVDFLRNSEKRQNYQDVAHAVGYSLQVYGLSGCMMMHGDQGSLQYATHGPVSPLEESIINSALLLERISTNGSNTSFNYPHACLVVRDMPQDDQDRCGRLRDHLAVIAEAASTQVHALDKQHQRLHKLQISLQQHQTALFQIRKNLADHCSAIGIGPEQQKQLSQRLEQHLSSLR